MTDGLQSPEHSSGLIQSRQSMVLRRRVEGKELGSPEATRLIGAIKTEDERVRYFFGADVLAQSFVLRDASGRSSIESITDVGGSCYLTSLNSEPLHRTTGGKVSHEAQVAEPEILAGRRVLMGSMVSETPKQIADWAVFHSRFFGVDGALVIDRNPHFDDRFDAVLADLLAGSGVRVILLSFSLPLGKKGGVAQNHVLNAPGAPGKSRIARPDPDPWRAPLGEPLLYELCKWAYLSNAQAVLALDVSDFLDPTGPNPFELCETNSGGCVGLAGLQVYPWRLRDGQDAAFGDHVFRPFDVDHACARWGVSPKRAGLTRVWRLTQITDAPAQMPICRFYRAMAVRFPTVPVGKLIPKASLIEDPNLIALSERTLSHSPIRAPAVEIRAYETKERHEKNTIVVTTMKNEGPFLLEWIAYHRIIGVTNFIVYTNDCTDGTDRFLALLESKGICIHRKNPWKSGDVNGPQLAALREADSEAAVQNADWIICIDADEFINIKVGDGTLSSLFDAIGDANMISLTWRLFGNSELNHFEDLPVIAQFTSCAPELIRKPYQAWGFKTLFRNTGIFRRLGVHRPRGLKPEHSDKINWVNGSGQAMPKTMLLNGWRSTIATYGYNLVQLNHYAVRSVESYLVKRDRGRAVHVGQDLGKNYWFRMNHNSDRDQSIQRMIPMLKDELSRLLSDQDILTAHIHSVACHRKKIADLMQSDAHRQLFEELSGDRMTRLCRMQHHFGSEVFIAGPDSVPDEVAKRSDLSPSFFFTIPGHDLKYFLDEDSSPQSNDRV